MFQHWGLGDLVMTVPVLCELRRQYPSARISLVVRGAAQAALLRGSALVDEILDLPPNGRPFAVLGFFASLRGRRFDAAFVATRITPLVPALLRLIAGVPVIVGDSDRLRWLYTHRNSIDSTMHRVDRMLKTLALWTGEKAAEPRFDLSAATNEPNRVVAQLSESGLDPKRYVLIHPGSGRGVGTVKRLPVSVVSEIVRGLSTVEPELRVAVVLGPDDDDLTSDYSGGRLPVTLLTAMSLDETKAVIGDAAAFIGTDSALGHIAAALGVPSVTCIGPTNPQETKPYGPQARVVLSPLELRCRPCWSTPLYGSCPIELRCMTSIPAESVLTAVASLLSDAGSGDVAQR